ncbi:MAG: flagellar export protein FliJ [Betaproteobacteria bacterium]|nr:flagellar export protein FliJ [Betaproteobacteria bacterium]
MPRPFPLQTLLDLARTGSDAAAMQLGVVNGHDRDMQQRLQLLLEYRGEYTARLARVAQAGMHSVGWRNFREFIDNIDAAIEQQRELVAAARHQVETGQRHWHTQQRRLKSFDTLSQRHRSAERTSEARQEQKEQDDFALKGFLSQRMATG